MKDLMERAYASQGKTQHDDAAEAEAKAIVECYTAAIAAAPGGWEGRLRCLGNRSACHMMLGRSHPAIDDCREVLAQSPDALKIRNRLGAALLKVSDATLGCWRACCLNPLNVNEGGEFDGRQRSLRSRARAAEIRCAHASGAWGAEAAEVITALPNLSQSRQTLPSSLTPSQGVGGFGCRGEQVRNRRQGRNRAGVCVEGFDGARLRFPAQVPTRRRCRRRHRRHCHRPARPQDVLRAGYGALQAPPLGRVRRGGADLRQGDGGR